MTRPNGLNLSSWADTVRYQAVTPSLSAMGTVDVSTLVAETTNNLDCVDLVAAEQPSTVPVPVQQRRKVSGRAAFSTGCAHGGTPDIPCPKFGSLPGNGRGIYQPGIFRIISVIVRSLIKPLFLLGMVAVAGLVLLSWSDNVLQFGSKLPGTTSGVPIGNGPTPDSSVPPSDVIRSGFSPDNRVDLTFVHRS